LNVSNQRHGGALRRRFLARLLSLPFMAGLLAGLPGEAGAATRSRTQVVRDSDIAPALAAFLDTLLPRDASSGSASDLSIPKEILAESHNDPLYTRLLNAGCQWLDQAAEGSFADAAPRVRDVIVAWAAESDWDGVPRRFYELLRQRALELYYSKPEAWGGLPLTRPPQPIGYPEPWA